MSNATNDSVKLNYARFCELCVVEDPENFGGFRVADDGLFLIPIPSDALLTTDERAAILCGLETGSTPALSFPCTIGELREFAERAGLTGCINEEFLGENPWPAPAAIPAPPASVATPADWIESARTLAIAYIAKHKAQDLFPSQVDVCGHVQKIMRTKKEFGPQRTPLSASYIQRNAIQGDWWKANKP